MSGNRYNRNSTKHNRAKSSTYVNYGTDETRTLEGNKNGQVFVWE